VLRRITSQEESLTRLVRVLDEVREGRRAPGGGGAKDDNRCVQACVRTNDGTQAAETVEVLESVLTRPNLAVATPDAR